MSDYRRIKIDKAAAHVGEPVEIAGWRQRHHSGRCREGEHTD
jgi:hypothetical protein